MKVMLSDIVKYLELHFPKHLAYPNDPIGLHVGHLNREVKNVLVTLDVTESVVKEAIEKKANLIVAHHPFIFKPLTTINTNTPKGKIIELCLKHDIAIYSMHTNYDIAKNGMNDLLAQALLIKDAKPLSITGKEEYSKIVIYVPKTHADLVIEALGDSGAGQMGQYSHCTFSTEGMGQFKPLEGSHPYLGEDNKIETVAEVRVEAVAKTSNVQSIIKNVSRVHPYEVMAFDVFHLAVDMENSNYGLGRIGNLETPTKMTDYINIIKENLNVKHARFIGNLDKTVKTVAVIGGSGSSYMHTAKMQKADLFVTGDVGFHDGCDALEIGLNILDVGHHAESIMKKDVAELIHAFLHLKDCQCSAAMASEISTEPFQFV